MNGCSLDLCLSPMTPTLQFCRQDSTDHSSAMKPKDNNAFYNEGLSEYDLVEIQIRAIIEMARKDREVTTVKLAPVRMESPLGCSVKRSVKRFLEKRKKRSKTITLTPRGSTSSSSSSPHHF
ncbi:PREDICTED: protein JAZ13-like isoform X2 [Camelina sativa]|uniref:Protein JAZ13-like isoform X2 n=1 Tax=Camelina sativa TaxID=90675 RepID=A0ABM1Q8E8_CAMSA|nr:PREDICTED: protein JAZ13-like isoform X2 [Camelina sativa]